MSDIEIARNTKLKNIVEVAKSLDINEEDLELYGKYKAKISDNVYRWNIPYPAIYLMGYSLHHHYNDLQYKMSSHPYFLLQ